MSEPVLLSEPIFSIFIPMRPKGKGRHRTMLNGHSYPDPETVKAEQLIQLHVGQVWRQAPLEEPVDLDVIAWFERPKSKPKKLQHMTSKPDWDNLGKTIGDALNGILWRDDSVIVGGSVRKRYCDVAHPQPGFGIVVSSPDGDR